jgi:hypothetical protein
MTTIRPSRGSTMQTCPARGLPRLLPIALCLLAAGCGSDLVAVTGTVTLDDGPLPRGTIVFQAEGAPTGYGEIQSDGSYEIRTGDRRGMMPGTYRVTVTAYQVVEGGDAGEVIPALLTPARYNDPATSGLTAEVGSGSNHFPFALTR